MTSHVSAVHSHYEVSKVYCKSVYTVHLKFLDNLGHSTIELLYDRELYVTLHCTRKTPFIII
jgi:hypothetical protein